MIPHQYRTVAFTDVDVELDESSLRDLLLSRQVYRRTRYVLARQGDRMAVVELTKPSETDLFGDVTGVRLLAGPDETVFVERPEIDTAVPSQLANVAAEFPEYACVVVRGRYEHVNFILNADVRRVHVLDVAPPWPAKLFDQVERLVDTAEELPPTKCIPQIVDLETLAATVPSGHYLLPCRGGGMTVGDATISYLDEVPEPADWVLLGCARSRAIHDHFYPDKAADLHQIDICPAALALTIELPPGEARLTKCCLLEEHVETRGDTVVVPWGASFTLVAQGLADAADLAARLSADIKPTTTQKSP